MDLKHISALLALLMDGEWGAAVIRLIAKPMSRKQATEIWQAWAPYLSHPHSSPMGPIQVPEATIKVLIAHYKHGPAAIEAVKDIRDYAEASLTLSPSVEKPTSTSKRTRFRYPPTAAPLEITLPRAIRPSSSPHLPQE